MVAGWFGGAWEWDGDGFVMVREMLEDGSMMVRGCLGIVWGGSGSGMVSECFWGWFRAGLGMVCGWSRHGSGIVCG